MEGEDKADIPNNFHTVKGLTSAKAKKGRVEGAIIVSYDYSPLLSDISTCLCSFIRPLFSDGAIIDNNSYINNLQFLQVPQSLHPQNFEFFFTLIYAYKTVVMKNKLYYHKLHLRIYSVIFNSALC